MRKAAMSETAVERRLREMAEERRSWADASTATVRPRHESDAAMLDAGREAIALLKKYGEFGYCLEMWLADRAALLARCEGEK